MDLHIVDELQRTCINTHITALQFHENFLLVAEGNEVQVYDCIKKCFIQREIIFNSCAIHGIRIGADHKFLFFGAKSIKILSVNQNYKKWEMKTIKAFNLEDWILDVQWLESGGQLIDSFAAITAHNCLSILSLSDATIQKVQCSENCILYSASIISCKLNTIVLTVGTVFRKILLWSPNSKLLENERNTPFHELTGHQGVIFSITYNESSDMMCSTSDDRSLRVWKIKSTEKDKSSLKYWQNSKIDNIYVLFAHESRVWRSAILNSCILSIGEDSLLCVWSLNGKLLKKIKCHKGGSIWCLETAQTSFSSEKEISEHKETTLAFTGGSDGGVYMWNISKATETELTSQVHLYNSDKFIKDFPRVCALFSNNIREMFVASTDNGRISLYDMQLKTWKDIFYDESFSSYCIVSISNNNAVLALGNMSGDIIFMNLQESSSKCNFNKFQIHKAKICALHWVNEENEFLLSCSTEGHMALWKIVYEAEFTIHCIQKFYLPKCKTHWWTTAGLFLHHHNILIVGDRSGTVSVYHHDSKTSINLDSEDNPVMTHRYIHGDNGVTDIQEQSSFVYSAGRDGKVNQYSVENGILKLLHCIKVSHDLEWIGKMLFWDTHLLLLGFHTKDFVVWSTQLESALMSVECGGGHRSWDFSLTKEGLATYVAIKKKDIVYHQQNLKHVLEETVLKAGISGQKFSCLTYLFTKPYKKTGTISVVACGGEDNAVRIIGIINIPEQPSKIIALCSLSGHLSSIRSIGKVEMLEKDSWLLASVGGRSQIMVWKLNAYNDEENIKCEELISELLSNTNKKAKVKSKENGNIHVDSQTRLMDVVIRHSNSSQTGSENFIIAVACSDSFFRLYKFDVNKKEFLLDHIFKHGDHCIMKLRNINLKTETLQTMYITGATNGSLKFLSCESGETCTNVLTVLPLTQLQSSHKSGINALDVKSLSDSVWMICSGGDDNSIMVAIISFKLQKSGSPNIVFLSKCHELNAHASQITGVKILDKNIFVSASVDQRVNIWKVEADHSFNCIKLYSSAVSYIPDIANLECWQNGDSSWTLAVCGQGIEVLNFKKRIDGMDNTAHFLTS